MDLIGYEQDGRVAIISLDRPRASNAQNPALLEQLDAAWSRAAADDDVRVIVLRAEGKHFSAGHDLNVGPEEFGTAWGESGKGIKGGYGWELDHFFGYSRRWRDIPKPSIAAVQGACIAAGLMLCWPCDLIVAAEDAYFTDPVIRMGMPGVEYHGHTWEWGPRKAKEMLFTGAKMSAEEARQTGMVNRVVPRDRLDAETLSLAREIGEMDPFGLALSKRAVNGTLDIIGQHAALQYAYDVHWVGHGNALVATDNASAVLMDLDGMKAANKSASKDSES
jgi:enoyl-CoA hydratase